VHVYMSFRNFVLFTRAMLMSPNYSHSSNRMLVSHSFFTPTTEARRQVRVDISAEISQNRQCHPRPPCTGKHGVCNIISCAVMFMHDRLLSSLRFSTTTCTTTSKETSTYYTISRFFHTSPSNIHTRTDPDSAHVQDQRYDQSDPGEARGWRGNRPAAHTLPEHSQPHRIRPRYVSNHLLTPSRTFSSHCMPLSAHLKFKYEGFSSEA
jgi:hypothetical protein